jgi:formylglycine-generating enzyme required for sulfatase activity
LRLTRILFIIFTAFLMLPGLAVASQIKNIKAVQKGDYVVFEYDIVGNERETMVSLTITVDGVAYRDSKLHIEGDYGKVKVGRKKKIRWNVLKDFPMGIKGSLDASIDASDFSSSLPKKSFAGRPIKGMAFVSGGCFHMGNASNKAGRDEKPFHEVCVDDFYIDKFEVTQMAYNKATRKNPSRVKKRRLPVERVTWDEARKYCKRAGKRLPTEAEWEYASRSGGKKETWAGTSNSRELGKYAWHKENAEGNPHPIGKLLPNALGLYDMSGNVWEWVADKYDKSYYRVSPKDNPKGPASGTSHVLRGGSHENNAGGVRTTNRNRLSPKTIENNVGFRCAKTL